MLKTHYFMFKIGLLQVQQKTYTENKVVKLHLLIFRYLSISYKMFRPSDHRQLKISVEFYTKRKTFEI